VTANNKGHIVALIKQDRWVRTLELYSAVGIGKPTVITMICDLGYDKVCAGMGA
jgi:hypothetical protein